MARAQSSLKNRTGVATRQIFYALLPSLRVLEGAAVIASTSAHLFAFGTVGLDADVLGQPAATIASATLQLPSYSRYSAFPTAAIVMIERTVCQITLGVRARGACPSILVRQMAGRLSR